MLISLFIVGCSAVDDSKILVGDSYTKGSADAPVTMVAFEDFQCGFCEKFNLNVLPQLEKEYISTGKVKFVYKDFPVADKHPEAQKAAEAARCAGEQGKFWEYHDVLYANKKILSNENYHKWADELKLSNEFDTCLDNNEMAKKVKEDYSYGLKLSVDRTPTVFVNGVAIRGLVTYQEYKDVIEKALKS